MVPLTIEAAHKKGAGSTKNGRDSISKRRGVKVYGGQPVPAGGIIIRQLGTKVSFIHRVSYQSSRLRYILAVSIACILGVTTTGWFAGVWA